MSKALRNFLIIFLILAVLAAACWFLFIHRSGLPATVYTSIAEFFGDHGRESLAVDFYAKASAQEPENVSLAIRTAEAYESCGNFTKAEYVLVRAISHSPDALDGYLALSGVYVRQDKLLDAERLISACANESIKEQLTALRPAAPVIQSDVTFSLEPFAAALSYSGGIAYYSLSREYPTTADAPYADPIAMDYGVTHVSAIVVGDNGLVSPLAEADFTVCGELTEVSFLSEEFETWYREENGIARHESILSSDLWTVSELTISAELTDLRDLSHFVGLEALNLQATAAEDLSVLSSLPMLRTLDLSGRALQAGDLELIAAIPSLCELRLSGCGIADVSPLASLSALTVLDLSSNAVESIDALAALAALEELYLQDNSLNAITALTASANLRILNLSNNAVENLGALSANAALSELYIENCGIDDLSPLENNAALTLLHAAQNSIDDLAPLQGCSALKELDISNNAVTSLAPLYAATALTTLDASSNALTVSPTFSNDNVILFLNLSFNQLEEVDNMVNLHELNYLNVNNNRLTDLSAIADLANLIEVDALQNPLVGVASLEARSIVVEYDPDFALPEEESEEEEEASEEITESEATTE